MENIGSLGKLKWLFIVPIVLVVLTIPLAIFSTFFSSKTSESVSTSVPVSTTDWKTYEGNGLSFKYPSSWKLMAEIPESSTDKFYKKCTLLLENQDKKSTLIAIDHGGETFCWSKGKFEVPITRESSILNRRIEVSKWSRIGTTGNYAWKGDLFEIYGTKNIYFALLLSNEDKRDEMTFDQILSTINLADQNQAVKVSGDVSSWQSYIDNKNRFSFKYPDNWYIDEKNTHNSSVRFFRVGDEAPDTWTQRMAKGTEQLIVSVDNSLSFEELKKNLNLDTPQIVIAGKPALRYATGVYILLDSSGNKILSLNKPQYSGQDILNQILSTLTFLN